MKKILFLGGTTSANDWRADVVTYLTNHGVAQEQLFNPVVEHWDTKAQQREDAMKANPNTIMLYYLGDTGNAGGVFLSFYSLLEATMGLYDSSNRTAVIFDQSGLVPRAQKRLMKACSLLKQRFPRAPIFESIDAAKEWAKSQLL